MDSLDPNSTAVKDYQTKRAQIQSEYDASKKKFEEEAKALSPYASVQNFIYGSVNRGRAKQNDEMYQQKFKDLETQANETIQKENQIYPFKQLQQQAQGRAEQFKMAFPSLLKTRLNPIKQKLRDDTQQKIADTRSNYNSRGLLYSGGRVGAEAAAGQDADKELATETARASEELANTQNELNQDVVNAGLNVANIQQGYNSADNAYRDALLSAMMEQSQQRDSALGGLLGAGGQLAGTIAGRLSAPKEKKVG